MENEIQIGHKKIGMSTEITFTVKTLFYILGVLFALLTSLFTWFYFNTQSREAELKKEMSAIIKEYNKEVKTDIKSLEQQIFFLAHGQNDIQTDIQTILNKQMGIEAPSEDRRSNNPITPSNPTR